MRALHFAKKWLHPYPAGALAIGLLFLSSAGWAETPVNPRAEERTDSAALPLVTVTAEKTERSIMDTATSSVVLDESALSERPGLDSIREIFARLPNVTTAGSGNQAPVVRGTDGTGAAKGSDAFFAGSRARLNVQVDGRPASYNEITFGDAGVWDVERVEMLIGPQSTLQGRNAIAGTMAVKTKDPSYETEAALRVEGGNYDQQRLSAAVGAPLKEGSAAWRFAADWSQRQSFIEGFTGFEEVEDPGEIESLVLRGKLLLEPQSVPGLETLLTLNHNSHRAPQVESSVRPFDEYRASTPAMPVFEPETSSLIADTNYELNSKVTLGLLASGTDIEVRRLAEPGTGIVTIDARELILEPRLNFHTDGGSRGVAGLYLFRAEQDEAIDFPSPQAFDDSISTAAIFGEMTLPLREAWDLTLGARYEEETHERSGGDQTTIVIDLDETYHAFLPKLGATWRADGQTSLGAQVSRGYNGGGGGFTTAELPFTNYQYDPEYVWNYEVFARKQLAEDRLLLTANLFYSDFDDMQLTFDLTPEIDSDWSFVVDNAEKAVSYGIEFGAEWLLREDLQFYANLGLLRSRINSYPDSGYEGNDQPFAPNVTASTGVNWFSDNWEAALALRYSGTYYSDIANTPRGQVDPYWLADAQLARRWGDFRFYGAVDNLFDAAEPLAITPGAVAAADYASVAQPRTWKLGIEWHL